MLKLKTILFIALAVTIGGVYAAWSYPTYVGTYTSDVTVPIEIEAATETDMVEDFSVYLQGTSITLRAGENDNPTLSFAVMFAYSISFVEGAEYDPSEKLLSVYGKIKEINGVSQYLLDGVNVNIFNIDYSEMKIADLSSKQESYYDRFYPSADNFFNLTINSNIILDTYEKYQTFIDCFEDAEIVLEFILK